jgi:flavin-dependent dehydrogenase
VPDIAPVALAFPGPALACARETLDTLLLDAALAAGASLERGRVEELLFEGDRCAGVRVRDEEGALRDCRARVVVGADGIGSVVARKLGLACAPRRGARFAIGGHYAGFADLDEQVEMYVGGGAYFALNPLGADRANVMVVVGKERLAHWSADVDGGVGGAAAALGRGVRSFAGATRVGPRVCVGPLEHAVRRAVAPGALLVGDAAGFLDPFTGQGIFLALTGAERAASAIVAGAHDDYARWRERDLRRRRRVAAAVALLIDVPPLARRAARRLARVPDAGATLLAALSGTVPPERAFSLAGFGRLLA